MDARTKRLGSLCPSHCSSVAPSFLIPFPVSLVLSLFLSNFFTILCLLSLPIPFSVLFPVPFSFPFPPHAHSFLVPCALLYYSLLLPFPFLFFFFPTLHPSFPFFCTSLTHLFPFFCPQQCLWGPTWRSTLSLTCWGDPELVLQAETAQHEEDLHVHVDKAGPHD